MAFHHSRTRTRAARGDRHAARRRGADRPRRAGRAAPSGAADHPLQPACLDALPRRCGGAGSGPRRGRRGARPPRAGARRDPQPRQPETGIARRTRMTISTAPAAPAAEFTPEQLDLRERARSFVEGVLIPNEERAEGAGGNLPDELKQRIKREAFDARLSGGLHAPEHGGQGWTKTEWFLVEEQLGRSTNALSWHMPGAYNVLANGSPEQIERYLKPALRGELHDAYAVTEAEAGSDPSRIATTARKTDAGWVIDGEKWFVTYGDVAAVYIVMANALVDGEKLPTLFLIDRSADGIEGVED